MITIKPASDLKVGDVFSTDGYRVESAAKLYDGRVSVELWLDASGGITKRAVLAADFSCPIWSPDRYVVIESTPGYLPEDDDPAVFDDLDEARVYASDRLSSLLDHIVEGQDGDEGFTVHGSFQDDRSVLVYDKAREHDLGRLIEIADYQEGL